MKTTIKLFSLFALAALAYVPASPVVSTAEATVSTADWRKGMIGSDGKIHCHDEGTDCHTSVE